MIAGKNLTIRLQERTHALFTAPEPTMPDLLAWWVDAIEAEPLLRDLLAALPNPDLAAAAWISERVQRNGVMLARDEPTAIAECWAIVRHVVASENPGNSAWGLGHTVAVGRTISDGLRAFLEIFVEPIATWIRQQLLAEDFLLHSLDRYAREAAWFRRADLLAMYEGDTSVGESTLDSDLRHHLFRDGVDYPYSQPHTPSGRPDVVVHLGEQPIPLEIKVFDPERGRGGGWVRSGFAQAIEYGHDYRRADAYLAVFDTSADGLAIVGDDPKSLVPTISASGVTVFVIVVPIGNARSASSRGKAKRKALDATYLTADDQDPS